MVIRAAGILVYRHGTNGPEILLLKSSTNGKWSPTKGQADSTRELDRDVALRETFEESGIRLEQLVLDDDFEEKLEYPSKGTIKKSTYFLAEILDGDFPVKVSFEHTKFIWANEMTARKKLGRRTGQGFDEMLDKMFRKLE